MPEIENLVEQRKALRDWIIGRLGGQWSDIPDEVLLALAARPELAFQLMLVNEIHDLGTQIEILAAVLVEFNARARSD